LELTRRLVDLFFVSVLVDAGAGDHWRYIEPGTAREYERSEGIAVASLYMFKSMAFRTGKVEKGPIVDGAYTSQYLAQVQLTSATGKGLQDLATDVLAEGFQVSDKNPMLGVESRADLLRSLGKSLLSQPDVFGEEGRPGNIVSVYACLSIYTAYSPTSRLHEKVSCRSFKT
jgi:hypothetical protein